MITLTVREIMELADFAGLVISRDSELSKDELDTEFTITECPAAGIRNEGEPSDTDSVSHPRLIAYYTECPEEGCIGLGPEIDKAQEAGNG